MTEEDIILSAKQDKSSLWGCVSIGIGIIGSLFILNFFLSIVPNNFQGLQLIWASEIGFAGIFFGIVGLIRRKDRFSLYGTIINFVLIIFPFAFWTIGTFIEGLIFYLKRMF